MTLIEDAEEKVIIVCPYYSISKWIKLLNTLNELKSRNIDVEIYVREDQANSIQEIQAAGFEAICVPNLHAKLYMNEQYAIVSSMNLLLSSENNSLEIGMRTETKDEYETLVNYYNRYLKTCMEKFVQNTPDISINWIDRLGEQLATTLGREVQVNQSKHAVQISASSKYEAFVWNSKTNNLRISGILSRKEFLFARENRQLFQTNKSTIELQEGKQGYYDMIWGTYVNIKSPSLDGLFKEEEELVLRIVVEFIQTVDKIKQRFR